MAITSIHRSKGFSAEDKKAVLALQQEGGERGMDPSRKWERGSDSYFVEERSFTLQKKGYPENRRHEWKDKKEKNPTERKEDGKIFLTTQAKKLEKESIRPIFSFGGKSTGVLWPFWGGGGWPTHLFPVEYGRGGAVTKLQ